MAFVNLDKYDLSVKAARVNANLTQKEMAEKLNISTPTLIAYESGANEIPTLILVEIAKIGRVPVDLLLNNLLKDNE